MCVHIVILGPVLGQDVVEQEQEQERILKATLCYVYMMPSLRRYIKYVLLMESHSSYITGPPTCRPK